MIHRAPREPRIDERNSTSTALGAAGTWTGEWVDGRGYNAIVFFMASDVDGTLTVQFSPNASDVDLFLDYEYDASAINPPGRLMLVDQYYRIKYVNGATAQTYMRLQSRLMTDGGILGTPLNIAVPKDADATVVRSIGDELGMAEGKFAGHSIVNKFGRNEDVDSGSLPETIWRGGGLYTGHPVITSTGSWALHVWSDDASDTLSGSGAWELQVQGLNSDFDMISETVSLTGTTTATSSSTYSRVFRAFVERAGADGVNDGVITISGTNDAIFAAMPAEESQTQILAYTVPRNHIGLIHRLQVQLDRGTSVTGTCRLRTRTQGGVWRDRDVFSLSESGPYNTEFYGGIRCEEKTDIRIDVTDTGAANNVTVTGRMDLILVEQ